MQKTPGVERRTVVCDAGRIINIMVLNGAGGGSGAGNCVPDRAKDPIQRVKYRLENGEPKVVCPPGCSCEVK